MIRVWLVLLVAGCGRYEFDPLTDASAASDASDDAPGTCAGHTFCDDFDRATPVSTGWDELVNTGGTISIVTGTSVSGPKSLLVAMPTAAVGVANLRKTFPRTATHARISFDLSYATANGGIAELDLVQLQWLELPAPCTNFGYYLVRDSTGPLIMQETYTGCGGNVNTPLAFGAGFHHVDMEVWFGLPAAARVTVQIDGAMVFDTMPIREIPASTLLLDFGVPSQRDIIAPWEVRYDDLTVDLE